MKKIHLIILAFAAPLIIAGCFQKASQPTYTASVDKKILFSLTSLSVETKQQTTPLEDEIAKRVRESMYFTKTKKGFVRVKIEEVVTGEESLKNTGFAGFFSDKELYFQATYTIAVVNEKYEELKKVRQTVQASTPKSEKEAATKNTAKLLDTIQESIFETSKKEFGSFLAAKPY